MPPADRARASPRRDFITFVLALGPTGAALALQFVTFAVTARGLGVAGFGLYAAVTAVAAVLVEVFGCGMTDALVRAVVHRPADFARAYGHLLTALAASFVPVIALGLLVLIAGARLALPPGVIALGLAGELIAARAGASAEAIAVAHGHAAQAAWIRLATSATRLMAALAYFAFARALAGWVWVVLGQSLCLALALLLLVARAYGAPRFDRTFPDWRSGVAFAATQTARALQGNADRIVLARYVDPALLGAYAAGARLLVVGLFPVQVLTRIFYPQFFRAGAQGIAEARRFALTRAPAMLAASLAAYIAVAIVAQALPHVLGAGFAAARPTALLLAAALPLIALQYLAADCLTGAGHLTLRAGLAMAAALLSGVIMVAATRLMGGVTGVIAGFLAGHVLFLAVLVATVALLGPLRQSDSVA